MFTVMNFKLTSNVMQEITKYEKSKFSSGFPELIVKVKEVERKSDHYWLTLLEGSGCELFAMFSKLLTRRIPIQDLMVEPVIKIIHYYLHKFKAAEFMEDSPTEYIDILGISDFEVLSNKEMQKRVNIELHEKLYKRKGKPPLTESVSPLKKIDAISRGVQTDESRTNYEANHKKESKKIRTPILGISATSASKLSTVTIASTSITTTSSAALNANKKPEETKNNTTGGSSSSTNIPSTSYSAIEQRVPISSLHLCNESPMIRVTLFKDCRQINIDPDTGIYLSCGFCDFSGTIMCFIFPPICEEIIQFLKPVMVFEIKKAAVFKAGLRSRKRCVSDLELKLTKSSQIKISYGNTIIYQFPPGLQTCVPTSTNLTTINESVPIAMLKESLSSPLIRGKVLKRGPSPKAGNGLILICGSIADYSGAIDFMIQEPISVFIDAFIRIGVAVEIKNAKIQVDDSSSSFKPSDNKHVLSLNAKSAINVYYNNKCLYKYPVDSNAGIPMNTNMGISVYSDISSAVKTNAGNRSPTQSKEIFMSIQDIKRTAMGVSSNVIGIVIWVDDILPNSTDNPDLSRRYIGLQDETGSLDVLLWAHYTAFKFPLGSIIKLTNFRLKSYNGLLELTSIRSSNITMVEESEAKNRLEKWYQSILHKFPW